MGARVFSRCLRFYRDRIFLVHRGSPTQVATRHAALCHLTPPSQGGKRAEYRLESTVSEERTHWVLRQTRWVLRSTQWVRFGTQIIGWEELTELPPRNLVRPKNSLSSVFETVLSEPYHRILRLQIELPRILLTLHQKHPSIYTCKVSGLRIWYLWSRLSQITAVLLWRCTFLASNSGRPAHYKKKSPKWFCCNVATQNYKFNYSFGCNIDY